MDIMDLNKLQSAVEKIDLALIDIEECIPNDAEYTEMVTILDKLWRAFNSMDNYIYNLSATWHDKED